MTPQEQEMLDGLIGRVQSAQLTTKDTDADRRIHDALGSNPNALYILCQTVLLQGYALEQAQKQLAALKEQANQAPPQHEPTFLEKIFGRGDSDEPRGSVNPPAQTPGQPGGYGAPVYSGQAVDQAQYGQPGYTRPGYGQAPAYGNPSYPPNVYPPPPGYGTPYAPYGGGAPSGGGFLQGALQTAAGVALGEMAFQSVESLFRGFGHAAGYGSDRAVGFGDVNPGSDGDYGQGGGFFSREQAEDGVSDQISPDIEDRRGDSSSFADTGNSGNGFLGADDSATDNGYDMDNSQMEADGTDFTNDDGGSGFDDGGALDDGGSFDDGGDSFADDNN